MEQSRLAQRRADKYLIGGTLLMGATLPGILGLPLFIRGMSLLKKAQKSGLTVRPLIVTLIGYMIFLDAALNCFGWALDLFANQSVLYQTFMTSWGKFFDAGYFWHYNELGIGGASAPGEKAWEITCVLTVFPMRMAACIGFLQMKRWGHQWLIVTCWFGVVIWVGYVANMTMYADIRFSQVVLPVIGWWLFDLFYITPFLAIPYLHTVNREVFTD
ncbi:MAG: hypothetical protein HOV68_28235 [Streptomycetaceae bacterium]|nr:hypothetical protein [Streptomycetaceae bacterium]